MYEPVSKKTKLTIWGRILIVLKTVAVLGLMLSIYLLFFYLPAKNAERRAPQIEARKIEAEKDATARDACGRWIFSLTRHPSTLKLDYGTSTVVAVSDGGHQVFMSFSAKNSFGLELTQSAWCEISADGIFVNGFINE